MKQRCQWAGSDPLYQKYHDEEWGVPVHEDQKLFEMLILESAQAGLQFSASVRTIEKHFHTSMRRKLRSMIQKKGLLQTEWVNIRGF